MPTSPEENVTVFELLDYIYAYYDPEVRWFTSSDLRWLAEQVVKEKETEGVWYREEGNR